MKNSNADNKPWYQHFWLVYILGSMGIVIIACLFMVKTAIDHPDPVIDGNYYKHGLTINERLPDSMLEQARADQEAHLRDIRESADKLRKQLEAEHANHSAAETSAP